MNILLSDDLIYLLNFVNFFRFWGHIVMAYAFTFWTCYVLLKEYEKVATMRLGFLAAEKRRPDQFTVKWFFHPSFLRKLFNYNLFIFTKKQ